MLKKSAAECRELAEQMLNKVGLGERMHYAGQPFGGQQQQVAIAGRAAMKPKGVAVR